MSKLNDIEFAIISNDKQAAESFASTGSKHHTDLTVDQADADRIAVALLTGKRIALRDGFTTVTFGIEMGAGI